jgi:hypothetical protein
MQDQNMQATNPQNSDADDFYNELENNAGVTEDQLKVMSAITEAQVDSAENAEELLKEMEEMAQEDQDLDK